MEEKRTDREFVHEIRRGDAVVEIYQIFGREKTYFDVCTKRVYINLEDEERRGSFLQQRDLRHLVIALVEAEIWISERHRSLRKDV